MLTELNEHPLTELFWRRVDLADNASPFVQELQQTLGETPYFRQSPTDLITSMQEVLRPSKVLLHGLEYQVHPGVFPSHKTRTISHLLTNCESLVAGKHICDMGCGFGVVGLHALHHGAYSVVAVDTNTLAIENTRENIQCHGYTRSCIETYVSDCFDHVPEQQFDCIIFNPPFFSYQHEAAHDIDQAIHDPGLRTLKKFLQQAHTFSHRNTLLIVAYSSRCDIQRIEHTFGSYNYQWMLWKRAHEQDRFDTRLYVLTPSPSNNGVTPDFDNTA